MSDTMTIKTSEPKWLERLARAYKDRTPVMFIDDAGVGVDPRGQTLIDMGRQAGLSNADYVGVAISVGVSAMGAWLVVMAVLDPEPYSKVAFAIGAGATLTLSGGFMAVRILTRTKPPSVKVGAGKATFEIGWD